VSRDSIQAWTKAYDWSDLETLLDSALSATDDPDFRTTLLAGYIANAPYQDSVAARMLLAEVPPDSWKWGIGSSLLSRAIYSSRQPDSYVNFALAVLRKHSNRDVRADVLQTLLWRASQKDAKEEVGFLYAWLVSEYPESFQAQYARTQFDPDRAIQIGRPVPTFTVVSIGDTTVSHSSDSMKGTVYLMDFWAVWCGPCINELPYLEAAYEKYRDRGFTILSLSFDPRPEDVTDFRAKGDHPMPWLHGFVTGGFQSQLAETFQVLGIPKPILIGADGAILATESTLRGESLDSTLAQALNPHAAGR